MRNLIPIFVAIVFAGIGNPANAFTCTATGLFANTDSTDCKTFVSCGYTMQPKVHSCPDNTFFWPAKQGCFSQYQCVSQTMPGNTNPCEGNDDQDLPDPSSADCSKFIRCYQNYDYNDQNFRYPVVESVQCNSGSAYRPGIGCATGYKCANYPCTTEGFFENSNSVDCKTFVECWKLQVWLNSSPVTKLYSNVVSCPSNSKYNSYLKKCDSNFVCGQSNPYGGVVDPCGEYNWEHPKVPNPLDSTQKSYLSCRYEDQDGYPTGNYVYRNGILKKECPAETFFSPLLGKCYSAHIPNENCSKDPCSSGPGQYANYPSGGCQTLIECRDDSGDSVVYKPTYEIRFCPPGTLFAPTAGKATGECVANYACKAFPAHFCYPAIPTTTTTTMPPTPGPT